MHLKCISLNFDKYQQRSVNSPKINLNMDIKAVHFMFTGVCKETEKCLGMQDFNTQQLFSVLCNHSIMRRRKNNLVNLVILSSTCPLAGIECADQRVAMKSLTRRFSPDQSWLGESSSARGSQSVGSAWESSIIDKHSSARNVALQLCNYPRPIEDYK